MKLETLLTIHIVLESLVLMAFVVENIFLIGPKRMKKFINWLLKDGIGWPEYRGEKE